jgi:hypothetical protein
MLGWYVGKKQMYNKLALLCLAPQFRHTPHQSNRVALTAEESFPNARFGSAELNRPLDPACSAHLTGGYEYIAATDKAAYMNLACLSGVPIFTGTARVPAVAFSAILSVRRSGRLGTGGE